MADIRIKDLATLESASLTGDVFVIDGTTGTRKLNAFSPTFGGNATVTGTLTVNGATGSLGSSASAATSLKLTVGVGTNASPKYRTIDFRNYDDSKSQAYIRASNRETDSNASTIEVATRSSGDVLTSIATFSDSQLSIAATTASTTTSTGALVVGNGTSGGLGVGGAIVAGGTITSTASTDSGLLQLNLVNSSTGTSASSLFRFNAGTRTATLQAYNDTHATLAGQLRVGTSNGDIVVIPSGVTAATFGSNTVSIPLSTASTSTSSGALVVSGGVGVAKRIHSGEGLTTNGDNETQITFTRNGTVSIGPDNTATPALVVSSAIKTSAPSGGTAANWKLGTVATVSPTSPNRTIEVDIGGTIYYLAAKTTNN